FVVWGGLHGIYLALNHAWRFLRDRVAGLAAAGASGALRLIGRSLAMTLTLFAVVIAWVFFRARSGQEAWHILGTMFAARASGPAPEQVIALPTVLSLAAGMALAAALHRLPVKNGLAGGDPTPDWPTHRLRPDVHYTFSDAWDLRNVHRGFTNNMGYVAPFPYRPGSDGIAVVGNSFIEGLMNRYEETLQGQLARLLPDAPAMLN